MKTLRKKFSDAWEALESFLRTAGPSLLPALGVVVCFLLMRCYFSQLRLVENPQAFRPLPGFLNPPSSARLLWGTASFCVVIASLWNAAVSLIILGALWETIAAPKRTRVFWSIAVSTILVGVFVALKEFSGREGDDLLALIRVSTGVNVQFLTRCSNALAGMCIWLAASAGGLLCYLPASLEDDELKSRADLLRSAMFSASVLLAIGVTEVFFLFSWAANLGSSRSTDVLQFAKSMAIAAGGVFTSFLFVVYGPCIHFQNHALNRQLRARAKEPGFDRSKWLKQTGLGGPSQPWKQAATLAIPLLTGLLAKWFGIKG